MFLSTRIKLTGWYLLTIMLISLFFSVIIYANVDRELIRFEDYTELRREKAESSFGYSPLDPVNTAIDTGLISDARGRLIANLALLNFVIFLGSLIAGYFLAGRTLEPIRKMLDDQARFIGDAAHELKTPLTSLRTEIEVYLLSKRTTKKEADEILESNLEEVIRLQNLSDSFLQLTSYERKGLLKIPLTRVDLAELLKDVIRKIEPQAHSKKIKIKSSLKKVRVLADEGSLTQLFVILLDNAIKYSNPRGEIVISVSNSEYATIRVADNGIGIAEEDLEHVFDRFYRVDKSRSSVSAPGYGLGLSIASEIVKLHNGNITVKSAPGKGSVFSVHLPKARIKKYKTER